MLWNFFIPSPQHIVWISGFFYLCPDLKAPLLYGTLRALEQIPDLCSKWKNNNERLLVSWLVQTLYFKNSVKMLHVAEGIRRSSSVNFIYFLDIGTNFSPLFLIETSIGSLHMVGFYFTDQKGSISEEAMLLVKIQIFLGWGRGRIELD